MTKLQPVTPPLSPVSDDTVLFEPTAEACFIDLTAEPSTPRDDHTARAENAIHEERVESGHLDMDEVQCTSRLPLLLPILSVGGNGLLHETHIEVPLISTNSSPHSPSKANVHELALRGSLSLLDDHDANFPSLRGPLDSKDYFEEAFDSILDARCSSVRSRIEQENFDPLDSASRIKVPVMDFAMPLEKWKGQGSTPREHLSWMKSDDAQLMSSLQIIPSDRIDKNLRWAPFSARVGRTLTVEVVEYSSTNETNPLATASLVSLCSADFVKHKPCLLLERGVGDEEISNCTDIDSDNDVETSSACFSPQIAEEQMQAPPNNTDRGELSSLDILIARRKADRRSTDETLLPLPANAHTTAKLLDGFMDMRSIKKRRLNNDIEPSPEQEKLDDRPALGLTQHRDAELPTGREQTGNVPPALTPEFILPVEKSALVISLDLKRSIIRKLEAHWPQDHLLDRDLSAYETHGAGHYLDHSEADVILTPGVGIVVTTLLKAKQKALPQSQTLPLLRARVSALRWKYELLYVLVSEANLSTEDLGRPSPSDMAAYADFVRFTCALDANVTTILVPGTDDNMSCWILSLICQYSPHALAFKHYLNDVESTWEVFLRRAGMNVMAAQVLAGVLFESMGDEGLTQFLTMSSRERRSAYSQLLGGEKNLSLAGLVLDQAWG